MCPIICCVNYTTVHQIWSALISSYHFHLHVCHPFFFSWDLIWLSLTTQVHIELHGAVPHDPYYSHCAHAGSIPPSSAAHASCPHSPYHNYPAGRVQVTTGPASNHCSPHVYTQKPSRNGHHPMNTQDTNWDCHEWEHRDSSWQWGGPLYPQGLLLPPQASAPMHGAHLKLPLHWLTLLAGVCDTYCSSE